MCIEYAENTLVLSLTVHFECMTFTSNKLFLLCVIATFTKVKDLNNLMIFDPVFLKSTSQLSAPNRTV